MSERVSITLASLRDVGGIYFLFTPLGGLVAYVFLFHATKPSALLLAGQLEKATALLTLAFFAFACAALLTALLAAANASGNHSMRKVADYAGLFLFAAFSTILAVVMIENFSYTMFGIGAKNTDSIVANSVILAASLGVFCAFMRIGPSYRNAVARCRFPIANLIMAIASVFALFNLSGNIQARADFATKFPRDYNVLILSSDGINAKRMSFYGYERETTPFLDSIKHEALVARSHYSNNGHTTGSVVSLLTGMLPTRSKVVFPPDSLKHENAYRSLPRLLREQGYHTNNIAVPHYADASEQNILAAFDINNNRRMVSSSLPVKFTYKTTNWLFDRVVNDTTALLRDALWLGEMPNPYSQVDGSEPGLRPGFDDVHRLRAVLSDLNSTDRRFFINTHFLGTHGPNFNPRVTRFSLGSPVVVGKWSNDHYDDAILSFDAYVKQIYKRLESTGLLEKTIIVVTSDHGISHEPRFKIPLIVRFPNQDFGGTVIRANTQTVDIAPTLVEYLGGNKPSWMEGQSLIGDPPDANRNIFSTSATNIRFAPSVGIISISKGRYGSIDNFYLMHCDMTYKLDVRTKALDAVQADDPQKMCNKGEHLKKRTAKSIMLKHLSLRFD
ncbi:MAG: sulfatase-like hydrolase/transferase [Pseudomonadota bacterium]